MNDKPKPKARKNSSAEPQQTFEHALERLEEIAARLESGDLTLEDAIALAEEGLKLSQFCERQLTEAEGKIEQLVERMGASSLEPAHLQLGAEEEE